MSDHHKPEDDEPIDGPMSDSHEAEDFDEGVDPETDEDGTRGGKRRDDGFSAEALFGTDGVFGPDGPFGRSGPFGPDGPFGDNGPFGAAGGFGGGNRGRGRGRGAGAGEHRRERHRGHQRHQRRKRMFGPGELRLVLLSLIAEAPRHGYELIKEIEDLTGGDYSPSPGVIYPTLSLLEDEGLIEPVASEESRKAFRITASGTGELRDNAEEVDRLTRRLGKHAEQVQAAKPMRSSDMLRALGNLATVIANRAANGDLKGERKDKAVDLIDELARRIERL